jgi:hypothetical protein
MIERAHPKHEMSGRRGLRFLKADGLVDYTFDHKNDSYVVITTKAVLRRAYIEELQKERGK